MHVKIYFIFTMPFNYARVPLLSFLLFLFHILTLSLILESNLNFHHKEMELNSPNL